MADNDLRELSFETAFAYQEQLDNARSAVMRSSAGILPPQATRDGIEYFAAQWLRQRGDEDVLMDTEQFNELVDTAQGIVQGFHTPAPRSAFLRTVEAREESAPTQRPPRRIRDMCTKLGVPCDFGSEHELVEWLVTNTKYQTWLTYAKNTGTGTIGEDIPREKPKLQQWMNKRAKDLRGSAAA